MASYTYRPRHCISSPSIPSVLLPQIFFLTIVYPLQPLKAIKHSRISFSEVVGSKNAQPLMAERFCCIKPISFLCVSLLCPQNNLCSLCDANSRPFTPQPAGDTPPANKSRLPEKSNPPHKRCPSPVQRSNRQATPPPALVPPSILRPHPSAP